MENNTQNADRFREQQQQAQTDNNQRADSGDVTGDRSSLASDGPVSKNEGTESADLTDGNAENQEQNTSVGFGGAAASGTNPATAGDESTDEDAANPELAETDTSKGYDRDQEELDTGLNDGDLDSDITE